MKRFQGYLLAMLAAGVLLSYSGAAEAGVIVVKKQPPAVKIELKPAKPFANAIWVPGHWNWNGNNFVWVKGHWKKPRHGFVWVPGHWKKQRGGYVWVSGRWKKI